MAEIHTYQNKLTKKCPNPRQTDIRGGTVTAIPGLILTILVLCACAGETDRAAAKGRSLEVHVDLPIIAPKAYFTDNSGRMQVIRPRASNRQLALVRTTVVNRTSTVIPFSIDEEAVKIGDRTGQRILTLNPLSRAKPSLPAGESESPPLEVAPLMWGKVELGRNSQATGWLIFDVPKGLSLGSIFWNEIEYIVIDYKNYMTDGR